jgi:hypothetical protein
MRKNTIVFYAQNQELFFLVRIPIQNPSGTLAFPDYKRTAKYEAH